MRLRMACALPLLGLLWAPSALAARNASQQGDLVVTEVMTSPENGIPNYAGQWFEIRNVADELLFIEGLTIQDGSGTQVINLPTGSGLQLAVGDHLVFGVSDNDSDSGAADFNGGIPVDVTYSFFSDMEMDPSADALVIRHTASGTVLDEVRWTTEWSLPEGASLQAGPQALFEWPNDLPYNWCASAKYIPPNGLKGTPGEDNEPCAGAGDDADGDGYSESQGDCDDTDPYVNPAAIDGAGDAIITKGTVDTSDDVVFFFGETNDDADCDGVRDSGLTDDDVDGYAEVDGDCDDDYFYVNPGVNEGKNADDVDDDCNCWIDDVDQDGDTFTTLDGATYSLLGLVEPFCQTEAGSDCLDYSDDITVTGNPKEINPDGIEVPYDGIDQDCDGFDECDVDQDTYDAIECGGLDCDDTNPNIRPGIPDAEATADGIDNDCDGVVDSPDRDGDGFGANDGDCDDEDVDVNPAVEERCDDGVDNNCDGWVNEGCAYPAATATLGGGSVVPWGCSAASGAVSNGLGGAGQAGGAVAVLAMLAMIGLRRREEA